MCRFGVADGEFPGTDAFEEVTGVDGACVDAVVGGFEFDVEDAGRVGYDLFAVHGDAAFGSYQAGAAGTTNSFIGVSAAMHHGAVFIAEYGMLVFVVYLVGAGIFVFEIPLHEVEMVGAPVGIAVGEYAAVGVAAGVGLPRTGTDVEVPVEVFGYGDAACGGLDVGVESAAGTVTVNLFQFADVAVPDEFAGFTEFTTVFGFGTLLGAGLVYPLVPF